MATYVYETIPKKPGQKPRQFEFEQKMSDPALTCSAARDLRQVCNELRQVAKENGLQQACRTVAAPAL